MSGWIRRENPSLCADCRPGLVFRFISFLLFFDTTQKRRAARLHVIKADLSDNVDSPHLRPRPQEMGKAKAQTKGKKGNKGKGKAKGNPNPVRDGCSPEPAPVRELAAGRNRADHWDDLRRAWAGYLSQQPKSKGGGHQPHHPDQQQQNHHHHHPGGQHTHTDRKRKAVATDGTADDGGQRAAKRHKGNPRQSGAGGAAEPHPDFWHPDGSVIVEVGKTKFKLHQSTLQRHSAYFADAFREKEGHQSGTRSRPGLPVYRVDKTTAEDFASLLTVIDEPMYVFWFLLTRQVVY